MMNQKIAALNLQRDEMQNKMRTLLEESFFLSIELDKPHHLEVMDDLIMFSKILWRLDVRVLEAVRQQDSEDSV